MGNTNTLPTPTAVGVGRVLVGSFCRRKGMGVSRLSTNRQLVLSTAEGLLLRGIGENGGGGVFRNGDSEFILLNLNADSSIEGRLGGADMGDALAGLRVDEEVLIAGLLGVRTYAGQRLIEPDADAVVAVVHTTADMLLP